MVKTSPSSAEGVGSNPACGTKIPHALWPKTQNLTRQHCNKLNKDIRVEPQRGEGTVVPLSSLDGDGVQL